MALKPEMTVDSFNQLGREHLPEYLGLRVTEAGDGRLAAEFDVQEQLPARNGHLHAAGVVALADTAAGHAAELAARRSPGHGRAAPWRGEPAFTAAR